MYRLAGYQVFCWLAVAFITLGGTSSRLAFASLGCGLALTGVATVLRRAAARRVMPSEPAA